jgi:predicted lipoprotein
MSLNVKVTKLRIALTAIVVILVISMALSTKVVSLKDANTTFRTGTTSLQANPKISTSFADKKWPEDLSYIKAHAVDIVELDKAIQADMKQAGPKYGHTDGPGNAYAAPIKFTGVGQTMVNDFLPVKVPGLSAAATIYIQMGPALNGTSLRDVTGTVKFEDFVNQLAYQDAATKLNDKVRELVLKPYKHGDLVGKTISIFGAMSITNPTNYVIIPTEIVVGK